MDAICLVVAVPLVTLLVHLVLLLCGSSIELGLRLGHNDQDDNEADPS